MESLYKAIIKNLEDNKPLFIGKGLIPPVTIDLYNGQPEALEFTEVFTPAVFIDYSIQWEHGTQEFKHGKLLLTIHILVDPLPGTANHGERQSQGLKKIIYYNLIADLVEAVRTETAGTLVLIGEEPRPLEFYNYHILQFQGVIRKADRSKLTKYPIKPRINLDANK